jgi:hypothetical protein
MASDPSPRSSRLRRLGQEARGRAERIRRVKVPQTGLLAGVLLLCAIAGAYVLWRSSFGLDTEPTEVRFFNIATGSTAGTYFPVGQTIAAVISEPPGSEACDEFVRCGVPGLLAIVKSSPGSAANVRMLMEGRYAAALVQADVADWAWRGVGPFEEEPAKGLRAIAALYPEAVHLVVRKGSGIGHVADLKGRRISIDRAGSGTQADALLILKAHGLEPDDLVTEQLEPSAAAERLIAGELDGLFLVSGEPTAVVTDLVGRDLVDLVPIEGPAVDALIQSSGFFVSHEITPGAYATVGTVRTISVKALLVTTDAASADLIHDVTAALWRPGNRTYLDRGHVKGRLIRLETALAGVSIPLHEGAVRYYREAGLIGTAVPAKSGQE